MINQEMEIIKCLKYPKYFFKEYLKLNVDENLIDLYLNNRFNLIKHSYENSDVLLTSLAYITWVVFFKHEQSIAIISPNLNESFNKLSIVSDYMKICPDWMQPKLLKDTIRNKTLENNSQINTFSTKVPMCGFAPSLLFWEGVDNIEIDDKFWTCARPTLQTGGRGILTSLLSFSEEKFFDLKNKQSSFHISNYYKLL